MCETLSPIPETTMCSSEYTIKSGSVLLLFRMMLMKLQMYKIESFTFEKLTKTNLELQILEFANFKISLIPMFWIGDQVFFGYLLL